MIIPDQITLANLGYYSQSVKRLPNEIWALYQARRKLIREEDDSYLRGRFSFISKRPGEKGGATLRRQK